MEGLKKGVPKQKSLNMIQALQQKPNEDPSEFLERIHQAYRKHTDADPQAPKNVPHGEHDFIGQSAPDIRKKLQRIDGALGMSPSQLVDTAVKVYNAWEERKTKQATVFLEAGGARQKKKQDPRRRRGPLGINQCAHCKEEGH